MIRATENEWIKRAFYWFESKIVFPRKFNKINVQKIEIRRDHSVLLLQNHFSWWDGFFGSYLAYKVLHKSYHVMVQEDQLRKHWYFRYKGAFSIRKKSRDIIESINYAAEQLNDPKNMVMIFPQGGLQSMHTDDIKIENGVYKLIDSVHGPCQIIYCAAVVDFLESFKPSVTFHLLDCGNASDIQPTQLEQMINDFHKNALQYGIRK